MDLFVILIAVLINTFVVYQDFKSRLIYIILFPLNFLTLFAVKFFRFNNDILVISYVTLSNLFMLAVILGTLFIWNKYIKKSGKKLPQLFAWGDSLYLVSITCYFESLNFVLFIMFSSFCGIFVYISYALTKNNNKWTIPFAGIAAAVMILILFLEHFEIMDVYNPWTSMIVMFF